MRKRTLLVVMFALVLVSPPALDASGPVGIYGIVERVVFEPGPDNAERVQVWGVFSLALVDGEVVVGTAQAGAVSQPARGYLYFKVPALQPGIASPADVTNVRREWSDLAAVAGTGQAIGFGRWGFIGRLSTSPPDGSNATYIYENVPRGGSPIDLRVRPASEAPAAPATYQTNAGIVKLADGGSHAATVKRLRDALARPATTGSR